MIKIQWFTHKLWNRMESSKHILLTSFIVSHVSQQSLQYSPSSLQLRLNYLANYLVALFRIHKNSCDWNWLNIVKIIDIYKQIIECGSCALRHLYHKQWLKTIIKSINGIIIIFTNDNEIESTRRGNGHCLIWCFRCYSYHVWSCLNSMETFLFQDLVPFAKNRWFFD